MAEQSTHKSPHRRVVGRVDSPVQFASGPLPIRLWFIDNLMRMSMIGALGALAVAALVAVFYRVPTSAGGPASSPLELFGVARPTSGPQLQPASQATATSVPALRIAIVSGHWSGDTHPANVVPDTGAVCDDGLKEVDINKAVADKVVALLKRKGWQVDLLQEFDQKLKSDQPDYAPSVFLAIHSDSCVSGPNFPFATGYKIAHAEPSDNPQEDDRLVACLRRDYEAQVKGYNLSFNQNTITTSMTEYHAFHQIVKMTPAAIIELGFIGNDRLILTRHQDELAAGIVDGLTAFLNRDDCGTAPQETPPPYVTRVP